MRWICEKSNCYYADFNKTLKCGIDRNAHIIFVVNAYKPRVHFLDNRQTMKTLIRRRLINVFIICLQKMQSK